MRPGIGLVSLAVLLLSVPGAKADPLENGDFSNWSTPTQPTGWTVEDTNKARIEQSTDPVRSPVYAVKITRKVAGTGNNKGIKQLVPVNQNQGYTLTAWYFDNDINAGGGIGITWRDADTNYISSSGNAYTDSGIHTWQILTKADTSPPNAAFADILLRVYGFSGSDSLGVVYVDDAVFIAGCGIAEYNQSSIHSSIRLSVEPNPFPGYATIFLELPHPVRVNLDIYDITGMKCTTIYSGELSQAHNTFVWNGTGNSGQSLPAGLYFAVLNQTGNTTVSKLVLQR